MSKYLQLQFDNISSRKGQICREFSRAIDIFMMIALRAEHLQTLQILCSPVSPPDRLWILDTKALMPCLAVTVMICRIEILLKRGKAFITDAFYFCLRITMNLEAEFRVSLCKLIISITFRHTYETADRFKWLAGV